MMKNKMGEKRKTLSSSISLGVTKDQRIGLYRKNKTGKVTPLHIITGEESALITAMLYTLFKQVKPTEKYLTIPYEDGKVLAITEVDITKEEPKKE